MNKSNKKLNQTEASVARLRELEKELSLNDLLSPTHPGVVAGSDKVSNTPAKAGAKKSRKKVAIPEIQVLPLTGVSSGTPPTAVGTQQSSAEAVDAAQVVTKTRRGKTIKTTFSTRIATMGLGLLASGRKVFGIPLQVIIATVPFMLQIAGKLRFVGKRVRKLQQ